MNDKAEKEFADVWENSNEKRECELRGEVYNAMELYEESKKAYAENVEVFSGCPAEVLLMVRYVCYRDFAGAVSCCITAKRKTVLHSTTRGLYKELLALYNKECNSEYRQGRRLYWATEQRA